MLLAEGTPYVSSSYSTTACCHRCTKSPIVPQLVSDGERRHYILLLRVLYVGRLLSRIAFKGRYIFFLSHQRLGLVGFTFLINMMLVALLLVHFWACGYILAAHVPQDQSNTWLVQFGAEIETNEEGEVSSVWWKVYINAVYLVITTVSCGTDGAKQAKQGERCLWDKIVRLAAIFKGPICVA